MKYPFYGTRSMPLHLRRQLVRVGWRRAALLVRLMGLQAIYLHDISERDLLRSAIAHLNAGGGSSQPFTESG